MFREKIMFMRYFTFPVAKLCSHDRIRHNRTSCSHTSKIVPEWFAERVWWTKSYIYFRLSGFQSSLLFIHFRYGSHPYDKVHSCLHCTDQSETMNLSGIVWPLEGNDMAKHFVFHSQRRKEQISCVVPRFWSVSMQATNHDCHLYTSVTWYKNTPDLQSRNKKAIGSFRDMCKMPWHGVRRTNDKTKNTITPGTLAKDQWVFFYQEWSFFGIFRLNGNGANDHSQSTLSCDSK